jgi:hypothetical protein
MRCPRCGAKLVRGKDERFEDISDHVFCLSNDPNWDPGLRPTWVCKRCNLPGFYDDYGSYYGHGGRWESIPQKYWDALDSHAYDAFFEINKQMQKDSPGYKEELKQEKLKLPDNTNGPWGRAK